MNEIDAIRLLEQRIEVLTSEFNGVLQEMQVTMEGLARTSAISAKSLDARLLFLARSVDSLRQETSEIRERLVELETLLSPRTASTGGSGGDDGKITSN